MKNHRHLKNSKVLRIATLIVLALCIIPLIGASASPTGAAGLLCAGLPMIGAIRMEEASDPANTDATGIPDAIRAIEDNTMPMKQRLGVALKALQGVDPTGQLTTIKAELDKANLDLKAKALEFTNVSAELETAKKQIAALQKDVEDNDAARIDAERKLKEVEAKDKDIDKRAQQQANEKVAALGFPSAKLPVADAKAASGTYEEALEAYSKITDPVKAAAFYASSIQPFLDGTKS